MGAGILPVTISNGILLFLMGKERSNNLWCDFGGSKENDEHPIQTAVREGGEELNGLLGLNDELHNTITDSMIIPVEFNRYTSFLFYIHQDKNLVNTFEKNNEFAEIYLNSLIDKKHNGLFEKDEIKWYSVNELKTNIKQFRPHYIPIINTIIYHENFIKKSALQYNRIKFNEYKKNKKFKLSNKTRKQN